MSITKKELELYIYKNNLQNKTLLEILEKLSNKTLKNILTDITPNEKVEISENELFIFSDGNCKNNGNKNAVAGFSVHFHNKDFQQFNITKLIESTEKTNNIAELSGINYIVEIIDTNKELFQKYNIIIILDSMYVINCLQKWNKNWIKNNWKNSKNEPVKNKELLQNILKKFPDNIVFKHVYSHKPEPVDKLSIEWMLWNGNNIVDSNINKIL